jgi:anthraniloyl-CoA monooxygenase
MTFLFAEGPHGPMAAHVYPYSAAASTFLVEAPEHVWRNAGLVDGGSHPPGWSDQRVLDYCQAVFASELGGASLVANGSRLLRFPEVRNQRWSAPGVVLLGDAAHTAHFSVGSGTSMAMEDAAELASCLTRFARLPDAFRAYEAARRPVTESVQASAWASSQLWERLEREAGRDASQVMLRLLTRTGQTDMDLLCRVDPGLQASLAVEQIKQPAAEPTAAVWLGEGEHGQSEQPFAVLVRQHQLDALGVRPPRESEWAALALIVDEADADEDAVERTTASLAQLRRCSAGAPAGVLYLARSGASPAVNFGSVSRSIAALARSTRLDFVAVGCGDATLATHATQMTLCEFVRAELGVPTVYACQPARLGHGRTQVAAARADHVWLIAGSP